MAIRNRHGIYDKFIPEKLVPGEFAFVRSGDPNAKDGKSIYASFDAGTTKRLATYEDMKENIALAADDVVNEVAEELNAATDRANTSAVEAETAATNATNAAEEAKHAIAGSKSPVYKSDGWPEVGEEGRLYIDDTVSPRLIYTWDDEKGYVKTGGSGGGSATVEEMTWAEYETLSEEEKMDGTLRVITDRKAGVRFGNVDISGIGDGTVTGAISAVNSKIDNSIKYVGKYAISDGKATANAGNGLYLLFVNQGYGAALGGFAFVCVTGYSSGCYAGKVAGGSAFMSEVEITVDPSAKSITVSTSTNAGFDVYLYKVV